MCQIESLDIRQIDAILLRAAVGTARVTKCAVCSTVGKMVQSVQTSRRPSVLDEVVRSFNWTCLYLREFLRYRSRMVDTRSYCA